MSYRENGDGTVTIDEAQLRKVAEAAKANKVRQTAEQQHEERLKFARMTPDELRTWMHHHGMYTGY